MTAARSERSFGLILGVDSVLVKCPIGSTLGVQFWLASLVDSCSILFNHLSLQKPAVSLGFLSEMKDLWKEWGRVV